MRGRIRGAALAIGVACVLSGVAIAATPWAVYRDSVNQFSVAVPKTWVMVPGLRAAALRLAASYEKKGEARQATLVRSYLADNYQSGENRVLDGIQYPIQTSPILTDFLLVKDHLPQSLKSNQTTLKLIARSIFASLSKAAGVKMNGKSPTSIRLKAGDAMVFSGTVPAVGFGGRRTGFAFYILLGPNRTEWQFEFRTDSRQLRGDVVLFRRIATSLKFG